MQPDRPTEFHVGRFAFTLHYSAAAWDTIVDNERFSNAGYGCTDVDHQHIYLNPAQSAASMQSTALHEALHAMLHVSAYDAALADADDAEEHVVSALESTMFAALGDPRNTPFWRYVMCP